MTNKKTLIFLFSTYTKELSHFSNREIEGHIKTYM